MKLMKANEKKLNVYRYPIFCIFHIPPSARKPDFQAFVVFTPNFTPKM